MGAAIVREGRLLACRRTTPPAAAGRWELPGGKVEDGETPDEALVREVGEELGVVVRVEAWLDGVAPIAETHELRVARCSVEVFAPYPTEHDRLRWVGAADLDDVDWLEPDRPFLEALRAVLT
ncbi:NUDIX domain-containing protein [Nocardioides sp. C4-1]|uniref:(deoxy)nucleoside triphosphate pyrophosphohydrolase n=1 Tax=Nocardioides sp. C4-1 TaxID=3151851 RepID=UPI0032654FE5